MPNGAVSQGPGAAGQEQRQGPRRGQAQRPRAKRNPELEATPVSPGPHVELQIDANYNGGLRSTRYSTGVAKKELNIIKLMTEKAAKLDRDTFGVDGAHGPWQQRLAEIGGIKPLAFGQFGDSMGPQDSLLALSWTKGTARAA
jgi:hypothetical protein